MDYFVEFYKKLDRQSPGSDTLTMRAFDIIKSNLPQKAKILDLGCGTGAQSLLLARNTDCEITAVDIEQPMLDELNARAAQEGLSDRITTICANITSLPIEDMSYDVIWSEGTLYSIGLQMALEDLKYILKPGGFIVFTDLIWTQMSIPNEIFGFWNRVYPEIDFVSIKTKQLDQLHFLPYGYFQIDKDAWTTQYFDKIEERKKEYLKEFAEDYAARDVIRAVDGERATYTKYGESYNFAFFIAQRPEHEVNLREMMEQDEKERKESGFSYGGDEVFVR